jgi:CRP-like cAMP-binding protein
MKKENCGTCCASGGSGGNCIRNVPVFRHMKGEDLEQLLSLIRTECYSKGSRIFREGERSEALFIVSTGCVKLAQTSGSGKEHVLRFLFQGDFFGQSSLLTEKHHYADAEAVEETHICRLARRDLLPLLERNSSMAFQFMLALNERLQEADEWAGAMHLYDVEARLAKLLLHRKEAPPQGSTSSVIRLPAAKKELAAWLGTTPETLSRKLAGLERAGIVTVDRRLVRILDEDGLRKLGGAGSVYF